MTALLKQRLVGAIVLISLAIIFIPMLLTGKGELTTGEVPTNIPPKPLYEIQAPAVLPLEQKSSPELVVEPLPDTAAAKPDQDKSSAPPTSAAAAEDMGEPAASGDKPRIPAPEDEAKPENSVAAVTEPARVETKKTETAQAVPSQSVTQPATTTQPAAKKPQATPAPEEKVATTPKKPPIVSGWVVQLGSFSKEKNAIRLRDSLRKNGHASFVEAYERAGKTSYRVRVGPELTKELAEELKKQLKQETKLDGLVMAFPG
ncbi:SPOR domain-containing protein [Kaarinaea lacus]